MPRALAARLDEVTASHPGRVALRDATRAWTYAELADAVEARGRELSQHGFGDGAVVLLASGNGVDWLTTLFASLRAGAVVAVVDPKLPDEQVSAVQASLAPVALLAQGRLTFPPASPPSAAPQRPDLRASGGRILYFTSGSTGLPKGVLLAEETLSANVDWNTERLGLTPGDVGCLYLPLSHSYNLVFALCFLLGGATLLLERDLADLQGTVGRMSASGATVIQNVPTSLRTLVERADLVASPLPAVRVLRVGAGVLDDGVARATFHAFPGASIVATYGMTELGLVASRTWTSSPIAESTFDRQVPGLRLDVLEPDDEGEGEIEIAHPLLFVGYFDAATRALALRDGPHRTGDLGAFASPGVLALRSRKKAVAKVAGVLINLDEVARVAAALPGVSDACAIAQPHAVFGEAVHVFVAASPRSHVDAAAVARRVVEETLLRTAPRVHVVERLPRSDTGKIQRGALEAIAAGAGATRTP